MTLARSQREFAYLAPGRRTLHRRPLSEQRL